MWRVVPADDQRPRKLRMFLESTAGICWREYSSPSSNHWWNLGCNLFVPLDFTGFSFLLEGPPRLPTSGGQMGKQGENWLILEFSPTGNTATVGSSSATFTETRVKSNASDNAPYIWKEKDQIFHVFYFFSHGFLGTVFLNTSVKTFQLLACERNVCGSN